MLPHIWHHRLVATKATSSQQVFFKMRQLKGKVKETRKQRKERKLENMEIHNQMKTVVLPILGVFVFVIVAFVYVKTRPSVMA
ncbi:putative single-pass membrane and coiled-coil domain-containing protein 4 [Lucilia cuprina]|uniref:Single-pass membrane and coiled-coil domain-containing protein 4 homolog n=2 Tax=Lucilia cuprina TaxID=7375 RepID=A0A0L0C7K4_LUCCU|nr:putative single-pass membrane and coiled-coil domain-containing protein 4 [Lucilia cuprina]